jgi:hypothetical protein
MREKDGRTNLESWLAQLRPPQRNTKSPAKCKHVKRTMLPFVSCLEIFQPGSRLTNARLRLEDRMENRLLEIHDGIFNLEYALSSFKTGETEYQLTSNPSMERFCRH